MNVELNQSLVSLFQFLEQCCSVASYASGMAHAWMARGACTPCPVMLFSVLGLAVWLFCANSEVLAISILLFQFDQFKFKCSIASTVFTFCNAREVTTDWW